MARTTQEWVAAVAKIRGYVKTYLGLRTLTPHQQTALQIDLATLDKDLAELSASLAAVPDPRDWSGTTAQAWQRFLDAEDVILIAAGKPAGRDGAERGSISRDEAIALAESLGVMDELTASSSGANPFGPDPAPGTIA